MTKLVVPMYRARDKKRALESKIILSSVKESEACMDCGIFYPYYVMQYDHVRGEKFKIISEINPRSERLAEEIAKCDLVCANCHSIRTYFRQCGQSMPDRTTK